MASTDRPDLPAPGSYADIYAHDQCVSLRQIVELLTVLAQATAKATPEITELREPKPAHRDAMAKRPQKGGA